VTISFVQQMFDICGRRALVTGASSGIGRHLALTLARAGAAVAVAARNRTALEQVTAEIQSAGYPNAEAVVMDVRDRRSVCDALDQLTHGFGVPHILVNNAGVTGTKRILEYTDEEWGQIVGTNLTGAWVVAQETARRMAAAGVAGSIINVTSILAERIAGGVAPYSAAKAGLRQLTRALALELATAGIRVNSLAPGYILTDLNRKFLASEVGQKLTARIPSRTIGRVEDLDGPLLLLASDASGHMTGSEIVVDGGHLCSSL